MPTTTVHPTADTFSGGGVTPINPDQALCLPVKLAASVTYPEGACIAELTGTPGTYGPYTHGDGTGLAKPVAILKYGVTTDAAGKAVSTLPGGLRADFPAYFKGVFNSADLATSGSGAADANTIANSITNGSYWRLIRGSITAGLLDIG